MKRYILPALAFMALASAATAQNNMVVNYNQHWNLIGSRQLPSKLGRDYSTVQFNIPLLNVYAYAGSSAIPFSTTSNLTTSEIDKNINRLRPINNIGTGLDVDWFAFSYKLQDDQGEKATLSFMLTDRAAANLLYSKDLMNLIWKGNKQYAGQTVDLGPLSVNAFHIREYALGGAVPLKVSDKFDLRAGLRLKYLQGMGALYMPKSDASLYTEKDGRYLDFNLDYEIHHTFEDDENGESGYNPGKGIGSGFGADLGVTVDFAERFSGSLSLLDLGAVTYKTNTKTYRGQSSVRYEGVEVKDLFKDPEFEIGESLEDELKDEEVAGEKFKMPTSTRVMLQGEYAIKAETSNHAREYNKSTVYFTYVQGLRNLPGATTRPFFSAGYGHSFGYVANLGLSLGYGGYNNLAVGSYISLRAGGFRFGVGSSNLTYLIARNSATGGDVSVNMGFAFGNSKPKASAPSSL